MSDIKLDAENSKLPMYNDLTILIVNPRDSEVPTHLRQLHLTFDTLFYQIENDKITDLSSVVAYAYATIEEDNFSIPPIWQANVCNPRAVPAHIVKSARCILSQASEPHKLKVHKLRGNEALEGRCVDGEMLNNILFRSALNASYYAGTRAMIRNDPNNTIWVDNHKSRLTVKAPLANSDLVPISELQYLITKLASECSELSHAALKAIEFGIDNPYPDSEMTVREKMEAEYNDILGVVQMLNDKGFSLETKSYLISAKIDKVTKMMDVAREYNVLENK